MSLERVQTNIGDHVAQFMRQRWHDGPQQFHIRELHDWIFQRTQIAPASPDRILRQLRLDGVCDYKVVDRQESLYEVTGLDTPPRQAEARQAVLCHRRGGESLQKMPVRLTRSGGRLHVNIPAHITCLSGDVLEIQ